jgi:hypothetical protein
MLTNFVDTPTPEPQIRQARRPQGNGSASVMQSGGDTCRRHRLGDAQRAHVSSTKPVAGGRLRVASAAKSGRRTPCQQRARGTVSADAELADWARDLGRAIGSVESSGC